MFHKIRFSCQFFAAFLFLFVTGCVVPGYPYYGPSGTVAPVGTTVSALPPAPGVVVTAPAVPYPYAYPYYYGAAPVVIAPSYYGGWGYGYWYGSRFWPYQNGCGFYNGRYYGGGWHGGCGGGWRCR